MMRQTSRGALAQSHLQLHSPTSRGRKGSGDEEPITPSQGIGTITKNSPPSGDDTLIAFLPAADFENYWMILTTTRQPHLRLITPAGEGTSPNGLTLASGGFPPDEGIC